MSYYLNYNELVSVMRVLKLTPDGLHRLKDFPCRFWNSIECKTKYGIRFKRTVQAGRLPGVRLWGQTVENHQVYDVGGLPSVS